MIYNCPNSNCHSTTKNQLIIKDGRFKRKCDSRMVQRFRCKTCLKRFSNATHTLEKNQKKRRVNHKIYKFLCSGVSMRRTALELKINYKTVARKLTYLGEKSRIKNKKFLEKLKKDPVKKMQFDDLITLEHTKMKPLSVALAVDQKRRFILGAEVSRIPAFGHLAKKSVEKYGKRENNHVSGLNQLFEKISVVVCSETLISSDEHKNYPAVVKKHFKENLHLRYKGGRSCVAGQGELKQLRFDPLFTLNHSCAMFRANINRLIRKTWCTTKKVPRLQDHIDIFISYYNLDYLPKTAPG